MENKKDLNPLISFATNRILENGLKLEVGRFSILWEGFNGRDDWEKSGKTGKSTKHQERGLELWLPDSQHPTDSRLLVFLTWCNPFPQGIGLISVTNKIYEYYYMWCLRLGTKKLWFPPCPWITHYQWSQILYHEPYAEVPVGKKRCLLPKPTPTFNHIDWPPGKPSPTQEACRWFQPWQASWLPSHRNHPSKLL